MRFLPLVLPGAGHEHRAAPPEYTLIRTTNKQPGRCPPPRRTAHASYREPELLPFLPPYVRPDRLVPRFSPDDRLDVEPVPLRALLCPLPPDLASERDEPCGPRPVVRFVLFLGPPVLSVPSGRTKRGSSVLACPSQML